MIRIEPKKERYLNERYLVRSMRRLAIFEDLPEYYVVPESDLQAMLDKWEEKQDFTNEQLYALRRYHRLMRRFAFENNNFR